MTLSQMGDVSSSLAILAQLPPSPPVPRHLNVGVSTLDIGGFAKESPFSYARPGSQARACPRANVSRRVDDEARPRPRLRAS
jgi:hypothetical protein